MSRIVYRLIKERFLESPLSAEGSRRFGGRWNPAGVGILYTSASPELALLEQLVHLRTLPFEDLPKLVLLTLELPDEPRIIFSSELPVNWRDEADFRDNYQFLANWLSEPDCLAVGVPSAVVAESYNYLLHSRHSSFEQVKILRTSPFPIDPRLWQRS
ncbi:RES family NAD+ phosphorylase [Larkinella sp.]|uniref:RES family NAD+ phosphorylase n=1 Tax=Larkinella sp. TaxID=2034517 RepID=UPI003BAC4835